MKRTRHSVKTRLYNTPILHPVICRDVTRWKQGYITSPPHTSFCDMQWRHSVKTRLYKTPPYFNVLASSVKTKEVKVIEFHRIIVIITHLKLCLAPAIHNFWVTTKNPTKVRAGCQANKRCLCNAGLMLGQRRRRWPNINTVLGLSAMFEPSRFMHSKYTPASNLTNAGFNVGPTYATLVQH